MRKQKGFTLIELLIVIAIIAILATIVFVALDPLTRFQAARDAQRWSDVSAMLDAAKVHQVDNGGNYLNTISSLTAGLYYTIGTCGTGGDVNCTAKTTQASCANLTSLVTLGYLPAVPKDPSSGSDATTDYYISRASNGTLSVGSCDPEKASGISVMR